MQRISYVLYLTLLVSVCSLYVFSEDFQPRWKDLCDGSAISYCVNVGKEAYNNDSNPITIRGIKLGKIIGVVWIKKGGLISPRGSRVLYAPKNAYYYIIDDGIGELFVRECSKIAVK